MTHFMKKNVSSKKRDPFVKRVLRCLVLAVISIIAICFVCFQDRLLTYLSVRKVNDLPVYYVKVSGNYDFDQYLKQGATSFSEFDEVWLERKKRNCSGFFATTPQGDVILAHDLDTDPNTQLPTIIETHYKNKIIGVSSLKKMSEEGELFMIPFDKAPYWMLDGMNEAGLSIAIATVERSECEQDPGKVTLIPETVSQAVLNNASTVEEAIHFLDKYNIADDVAGGCHFLLADAKGNAAIVEWWQGKMVVNYKEGPYQIFTNFRVCNNPFNVGFGADRFKAYDKVLSQNKGIISEEEALALLKENVIPGEACWSVVFNLTQKTMKITFNGDYEHTYSYHLQ